MVTVPGSGETARALIRMGATDAEALELVLFIHHPDAKTTLKTIRSYRAELVNDFEDVPSAIEAPGLDRARLRGLILGAYGHSGQPAQAPSAPPQTSHVETARRELLAWRTNQQVLDAVLAAHPDCGYTLNNVSDRRSRVGKTERVPYDEEAMRWQNGRPRATDPEPPEWVRRLPRS